MPLICLAEADALKLLTIILPSSTCNPRASKSTPGCAPGMRGSVVASPSFLGNRGSVRAVSVSTSPKSILPLAASAVGPSGLVAGLLVAASPMTSSRSPAVTDPPLESSSLEARVSKSVLGGNPN